MNASGFMADHRYRVIWEIKYLHKYSTQCYLAKICEGRSLDGATANKNAKGPPAVLRVFTYSKRKSNNCLSLTYTELEMENPTKVPR